MKNTQITKKIVRYLVHSFALAVLFYIVYSNIFPFGSRVVYSIFSSNNSITFEPKDRIYQEYHMNVVTYKQKDNLVYFILHMPFKADKAKVTLSYKQSSSDQLVYLGFRDRTDWHYKATVLDNPLLNKLDWNFVWGNYLLFQRDTKFISADEFLSNPPQNTLIGSFNLDTETLGTNNVKLADYGPKSTITQINTTLRGKHIMYVYLENEPFQISLQKQDLNWYEGEDITTINIYKEGELVYSATAGDDGITDPSRRTVKPQEIFIENPGPELPESGVYKIIIDAPGDTVVSNIRTNLHKIVFESPIFPVENSSIYPNISIRSRGTTVYTNANEIKAVTYHTRALQTISIDDIERAEENLLILNELNKETTMSISGEMASETDKLRRITIPQSDVILSAVPGYFAFDNEHFFLPTPYQFLPIRSQEDIEKVDYILADYRIPRKEGEWSVAEIEFDLSTAVVKDGKLSWLIRAPGLKENNREIIIRDIEVELIKEPLINLPGGIFK